MQGIVMPLGSSNHCWRGRVLPVVLEHKQIVLACVQTLPEMISNHSSLYTEKALATSMTDCWQPVLKGHPSSGHHVYCTPGSNRIRYVCVRHLGTHYNNIILYYPNFKSL